MTLMEFSALLGEYHADLVIAAIAAILMIVFGANHAR